MIGTDLPRTKIRMGGGVEIVFSVVLNMLDGVGYVVPRCRENDCVGMDEYIFEVL